MNEHDVETLIAEALNIHAGALDDDACVDVPDGIEQLNAIRTFAEAGVMTRNAGLVLYMDDGSEFQITIVHSH